MKMLYNCYNVAHQFSLTAVQTEYSAALPVLPVQARCHQQGCGSACAAGEAGFNVTCMTILTSILKGLFAN